MENTMSTATTQQTQQQIIEEFRKAQQRMLPAKLVTSTENSLKITAHLISKRQIPVTADAVYQAANELMTSLTWEVKPKKLLTMEQNERPAKIESAQQSTNDFTAKVRAGEVADLKAKQDAEAFKKIETSISSYIPIDRRGRVAFGKQSEVQTNLRAYVAQQVERNADAQSIFQQVEKHIADLYRAAELAAERA
jgi:hypothetical protein